MQNKYRAVIQLSVPRSSSNITALALGMAADERELSLALDEPSGKPYAFYFAETLKKIRTPKGQKPTMYFKELGASLTDGHLDELSTLADHFLAVQRDPLLVLESILRKLTLPYGGVESRIKTLVSKMFEAPEQREKLIAGLGLYASHAEPLAVLDAYAYQRNFADWAGLEKYMKHKADYTPADGLLRVLFPALRLGLEHYRKPQEYFTIDPFGFIRHSIHTARRYISRHGTGKISVVDTTAIRGSRLELERAANAAGLNPDFITTENWDASATASLQVRNPLAIPYIGRAASSKKLDLPSERPILPDHIPGFLKEKGGLLWEMIDSYKEYAALNIYHGPRTADELMNIFDVTVDSNVSLLERNPLYAYVAVVSSPALSEAEKKNMMRLIRDKLPEFASIFDYVDT